MRYKNIALIFYITIILTIVTQLNFYDNKDIYAIETINNNTDINKLLVKADPDIITVYEGDLVILNATVYNEKMKNISKDLLNYSWKQVGGPSITVLEDKNNTKSLYFVAPNRSNDTKYIFEVIVTKQDNVENEIIDLGIDKTEVIVVDVNKAAKEKNIGTGISN